MASNSNESGTAGEIKIKVDDEDEISIGEPGRDRSAYLPSFCLDVLDDGLALWIKKGLIIMMELLFGMFWAFVALNTYAIMKAIVLINEGMANITNLTSGYSGGMDLELISDFTSRLPMPINQDLIQEFVNICWGALALILVMFTVLILGLIKVRKSSAILLLGWTAIQLLVTTLISFTYLPFMYERHFYNVLSMAYATIIIVRGVLVVFALDVFLKIVQDKKLEVEFQEFQAHAFHRPAAEVTCIGCEYRRQADYHHRMLGLVGVENPDIMEDEPEPESPEYMKL